MPEQQKKKHSSRPRNPLIVGVCFKGGYIDAWGRGIQKILDACKDQGLPEPLFEESSGGILVTLFNAQPQSPTGKQDTPRTPHKLQNSAVCQDQQKKSWVNWG